MSDKPDREPESLSEALEDLAAKRDDVMLAIGEALLPVYRFCCVTPARLLLSVMSAVVLLSVIGWAAEGAIGAIVVVLAGIASWFTGRALARLHRQ